MLIIDAHEDLAFNVLADGRNYLESAYDTRAAEIGTSITEVNGVCMLGLPEWLRAGVAVIFATITAIPRSHARIGELSYVVVEAAYQQAIAQLNIYRHWSATHPQITFITHQQHLDLVMASWATPPPMGLVPQQVGLVLLIENADLIRTPEEVDFWYKQGIRIVGPAWHTNRYITSTFDDFGGLTDLGRQLLREMQRFGMVLDLSHMAEEACLEALDRYAGPVIASHANPRRLVPFQRCLSDQVIAHMIARDGVIGIMPLNWALDPAWRQSKTKADIHVEAVVEAIDIVCQIAGDARHVGIGTDFDGGQGAEAVPAELDTIADLPVIADTLCRHGYKDEDIAAVMGENWWRLLYLHLPHQDGASG
jgi:membrane dipeptidase